MIKLTKKEEPDVLKINGPTWKRNLLNKIASGAVILDGDKNKYRHPEIKAVLIKETNGKCAYCESKLLHIAYGDVEHIVPKSTHPDVTFDWENLTLACDVCNTNKGDKFSDGIGFVDPYNHDPEGRFIVIGSLIFGNPGDADARITEESLKLNRAALVERRDQHIRYIRDQIEVIRYAPAHLRTILIQSLYDEAQPDKEYSKVAKASIDTFLR